MFPFLFDPLTHECTLIDCCFVTIHAVGNHQRNHQRKVSLSGWYEGTLPSMSRLHRQILVAIGIGLFYQRVCLISVVQLLLLYLLVVYICLQSAYARIKDKRKKLQWLEPYGQLTINYDWCSDDIFKRLSCLNLSSFRIWRNNYYD